MSHLQDQEENEVYWKFEHLIGNEGPLHQSHPLYKRSKYNVQVEQENGEITQEPLKIFAADALVTCAIYEEENNLLQLDGWKQFLRLVKTRKSSQE